MCVRRTVSSRPLAEYFLAVEQDSKYFTNEHGAVFREAYLILFGVVRCYLDIRDMLEEKTCLKS